MERKSRLMVCLSAEKIDLLHALEGMSLYLPSIYARVTIVNGRMVLDDQSATEVRSDDMIDLLWFEYLHATGSDHEE